MYVAEFIKPLNEAETTPIFHSSTRTRVYVYTNSYTSRGFVHMVIATQLNRVRFISYVQMRCVHKNEDTQIVFNVLRVPCTRVRIGVCAQFCY